MTKDLYEIGGVTGRSARTLDVRSGGIGSPLLLTSQATPERRHGGAHPTRKTQALRQKGRICC
jgi:hypothetical protein